MLYMTIFDIGSYVVRNVQNKSKVFILLKHIFLNICKKLELYLFLLLFCSSNKLLGNETWTIWTGYFFRQVTHFYLSQSEFVYHPCDKGGCRGSLWSWWRDVGMSPLRHMCLSSFTFSSDPYSSSNLHHPLPHSGTAPNSWRSIVRGSRDFAHWAV